MYFFLIPLCGLDFASAQLSLIRRFHFSVCIIHPLPLRVLSLSQGEKVGSSVFSFPFSPFRSLRFSVFTFHLSPFRLYHPPPPLRGCPHVAMGIATLSGHRMTSSHSSKDPLRPPVSGGERIAVQFSVFTFHISVLTVAPVMASVLGSPT